MGLPAGQYSMQCWNSTQNPGDINRPKLLHSAFQLCQAMRKNFTNGEIAIPSTTDVNKQGIEICILYRAGANLFADIAEYLTTTAASMGLEYRNFTKQDIGVTRYFNQDEMDNIAILDKDVPDSLTEEYIAASIKQAQSLSGLQGNSNWRNSVPPEQRVLPFAITRSTLQRFHSKEGEDLAAEIRGAMASILDANAQTKSAYTVFSMIAKGAVWLSGIGAVGSELGGTVFGIIIIYNVVGLGAALAVGGVLVAAAAILTGGLYLLMKDATNVLLVINDSPNDLLPMCEHIENGERRVVPEMIPAVAPNGDFVSCGLFIYAKYQVKGLSLGSFGSAFGVSFQTGNEHFSIGMDCPNSLMGGNNSIEVHNQEHAQRACQMARDSGCMHGWTDVPRVDVKIADHWGNINWGRAIAMKY